LAVEWFNVTQTRVQSSLDPVEKEALIEDGNEVLTPDSISNEIHQTFAEVRVLYS